MATLHWRNDDVTDDERMNVLSVAVALTKAIWTIDWLFRKLKHFHNVLTFASTVFIRPLPMRSKGPQATRFSSVMLRTSPTCTISGWFLLLHLIASSSTSEAMYFSTSKPSDCRSEKEEDKTSKKCNVAEKTDEEVENRSQWSENKSREERD